MWIERDIAPVLRSVADTFPAVVLTGPRQVGKTSTLERTFPDYRFVSLDVAQNAETAETRPEEFLRLNPPPVILDEIQYAPAVLRHIKTCIDQRRGENGLFVLTGSQDFKLMESVSESLAGRAAVVPFLGLSATEWEACEALRTRHERSEFFWRGSYPGLWAEVDSAPARDRWYQGYVATYLERDLRNLLNVGSLRDFERFLRACAARTGQLLNMSEIGRDVGVSPTTAKEWISALQASNQLFLLEPYYRSLGKRLVKSPKLYFTDTGLAAFLAGFQGAEALLRSSACGAFWENHVVTQWLRWRDWHSPSTGLWFWRDQSGNEVDLVVETNQQLHPIEIKRTETPGPRDLRGIRKFREFYGDAVAHAWVACTVRTPIGLDAATTAVDGWAVWELGSGG